MTACATRATRPSTSASRARERELAEAARRQPAAEALEEVRHARLRRRPQRALRRSRRRRPARHADRAEHPARARRRLRSHQRADRGHPRRQGPVAVGPARPAQRAAHQRHAVPDPRHRRRRQAGGGAGPRLQAADPRRPHRQGRSAGPGCRRCPPTRKDRPYELYSGDSIAFVNLSGGAGARARSSSRTATATSGSTTTTSSCCGSGQGQTGHYPYPVRRRRRRPRRALHRLRAVGPHGQAPVEPRRRAQGSRRRRGGRATSPAIRRPSRASTVSGSDEGFIMLDLRGKILKHVSASATPRPPSVGKFRPDLPGLQYMTINFWKNPGIVTLFDRDGNILAQDEPIHTGSADPAGQLARRRQEFALLSGNVREGGMIDGQLRRVVMFPDDGHPDLACQVLDLTGDARDEIVLWDQDARLDLHAGSARSPASASTRRRATRTTTTRTTAPMVSMPAWRTVKTCSERSSGGVTTDRACPLSHHRHTTSQPAQARTGAPMSQRLLAALSVVVLSSARPASRADAVRRDQRRRHRRERRGRCPA